MAGALQTSYQAVVEVVEALRQPYLAAAAAEAAGASQPCPEEGEAEAGEEYLHHPAAVVEVEEEGEVYQPHHLAAAAEAEAEAAEASQPFREVVVVEGGEGGEEQQLRSCLVLRPRDRPWLPRQRLRLRVL